MIWNVQRQSQVEYRELATKNHNRSSKQEILDISLQLDRSEALLTTTWSLFPTLQVSVSWISLIIQPLSSYSLMPFKQLALCDFTEFVCGYLEMDIYNEYIGAIG